MLSRMEKMIMTKLLDINNEAEKFDNERCKLIDAYSELSTEIKQFEKENEELKARLYKLTNPEAGAYNVSIPRIEGEENVNE